MEVISAHENVYEQASNAVANLAHQCGFTTAPAVVADDAVSSAPHVNAAALHLTRDELRSDIATYRGRLAAPAFTAAAVNAIAAANATFSVDMSAHATPEQITVAEHFRALRNEWCIRGVGLAEATSITAAVDRLWRPDRYSGDSVVAIALLELLPRADATLIPPTAAQDVRRSVCEQLGSPALVKFLRLWRSALTGRPTGTRTPSLLDWIDHACRWLALTAQHLPGLSFNRTANGRSAIDLLSPNPSGDPLGRTAQAALRDAARVAIARVTELSLAPDGSAIQPAQRIAARTAAGSAAGGATVSGQRTLQWRHPTDNDHHNRRLFTSKLAAAGHRRPTLAPTPVSYPTGRTNTRQLVIQQAQVKLGRPVTATPWTAMRTQARLSEELLLAIVIDTSATMSAWTGVTVPLGWAAAHAVAELGGVCAVWGFAGEHFPIIEPSHQPPEVPEIRDPGSGSYGAVTAMREATAPLLTRNGCAVLVVVTDGKLPDDDEVRAAVADYTAAGIAVVWVMPRSASRSGAVRPDSATIIDDQVPATVAEAISAAVLATITERS